MNSPLTSNPKTVLSVVVPMYNVERFLVDALDSLIEQNNEKIEVILVDDGSSDNTAQIAQSYVDRVANWQMLRHRVNAGLGPARNSGIDQARGEYVAMLDSDDWYVEHAISHILNALGERSSAPADVVQFGCNKIYQREDGTLGSAESALFCVDSPPQTPIDQQKIQLVNLPSYAWLKVVRRAFLIENRIKFDDIYYEDIPWSGAVMLRAQKIHLLATPIVNYRIRPGSITNSSSIRHLDLLHAYRQVFQQALESPSYQTLKAELDDAFIKAAYYLHRAKATRLVGFEQDFYRSYLDVLKAYKIRPRRVRTMAMQSIIFKGWIVSRISSLLNRK